jgi:DNA-binding NarL/FixJ family response regulator
VSIMKKGKTLLSSTQSRPARVIIVDDHQLVRTGYRQMLSGEADLEVVGEAANGLEALELCRRVKPDLVLLDIRMPVMDGLQAIRAITQELPNTAILIVTTYEDPDYMSEALRAGAAGYVLKEAPKSQLINAVYRALSGENPLNEELAADLIRRLSSRLSRIENSGMALPEALTEREHEVLRIMAQGQTNQEIAQTLMISRLTVKTHVQNIFRKLDVSDRIQAVERAIDLGWLNNQ